MPKKHMIAKGCPKCAQQVPVACKACRCGHSFFNAKKAMTAAVPVENTRRRTQRVRREKPNYYDALEYDKQVKKTRTTRNSECDEEEPTPGKSIKPKKRKVRKEDDDEDDSINNLTTDKQVQCLIILAELNRKMGAVTWQPT